MGHLFTPINVFVLLKTISLGKEKNSMKDVGVKMINEKCGYDKRGKQV